MTGSHSNASCNPKTLAIGAYWLVRNGIQFLASNAPLLVAFLIGLGIQTLLIDFIVGSLESDHASRYALTAMLNVCCIIFLVSIIAGNNITIEKPIGLLMLMIISWIAMAMIFFLSSFAIAVLMLVAYVIAAPAIGFGWIVEWLVNHQIITIAGFNKALTTLLFYPIFLSAWLVYCLMVSLAEECCRVGQAHIGSK